MTKIVLNGDNLCLKTPEVSYAKTTDRYFFIYLNQKKIGEISFCKFSMAEKTAEFSITMEEEYQDKGYSKEAVALLSDYYFYLYNGKCLVDCVSQDNLLGQRYLEKLGFEKCGEDGSYYLYKMTKENFDKFKLTC